MRTFGTSFLILTCLASCGKQDLTPPVIGPASALRPEIILKGNRDYSAGTMYIARATEGGTPLLFTPLHLFGPAGSLKSQIAGDQLESEVLAINVMPLGSKDVVGVGRRSRIHTGATITKTSSRNDVAAFELQEGVKASVLLLADRDPEVGETVWVIGDDASETQRLWEARVRSAEARGIILDLTQAMTGRVHSGAPVVNQKGNVVGHLAGSNGAKGCIITSAGDIRRHLELCGVK